MQKEIRRPRTVERRARQGRLFMNLLRVILFSQIRSFSFSYSSTLININKSLPHLALFAWKSACFIAKALNLPSLVSCPAGPSSIK